MKIKAFTLAEVLVTLTIIGVVSSMTIPTLMNKNKEVQTISVLKNTYSTLSNAIRRSEIENGKIDEWSVGEGYNEGSQIFINYIIPYLKDIKKCKTQEKGCFAEEYKTLNGSNFAQWNNPNTSSYTNAIILNNGVSVSFFSYPEGTSSTSSNAFASITVDINGLQKPNKAGVDLFYFYIDTRGLFPTSDKTRTGEWDINKSCNIKSSWDRNGLGCTAWVVYKGNMDYLKRTVSWDE